MKKIKSFILLGYTIAVLTGCGEEATFKSIELNEAPKTTFYCGEEFSNAGISLKVNLTDGTSFISEDVATSKPSTSTPGTQTVKVYYTNDKYDVDTFITYEINIIDWTKEEKAIFSETTISTFSGVYYPKMEGMQLLTEIDDETNEIVDYWIEKKNCTLKDVDEYCELLKNYNVVKKVTEAGQTVDMTFKFYEQPMVPTDFVENFDLNDAICFKYCASYEYLDQTYFEVYQLYGNEIEDTVVVGLNDTGDMVVRYIANSIFMENILSCEVNERLDMRTLYNGTIVEFLKQTLLGFDDEESGQHYIGRIEEMAPFAKPFFILPDYEPDVVAVKNLSSMYPWEHGEDDLCFEIQIDSDDVDGYEDFVAALDAKTEFVKTTGTTKVEGKNAATKIYTIENMDYVGSIEITVSDFMEKAASYTIVEGSTRTTVECGAYIIGYSFIRPEVFSPTLTELYRIYDAHYGEGNYDLNEYDPYEEGTVGGLVKFANSGANGVSSKDEALDKFVASYLQGYTLKSPKEEKDVNGYNLVTAKYTNGTYEIEIFAYFGGAGKYNVEFSVALEK